MTDTARDRDAAGKARSARPRDRLGRPLAKSATVPVAAMDRPALPPQEALAEAQSLLDDGRPFEAHEVLEAVWKAAVDDDRDLWRGLAQLAVGITHALRGNSSGSHALLARSAESLAPYAGTTPAGIDVDGLLSWTRAAAASLALASQPPRLTG